MNCPFCKGEMHVWAKGCNGYLNCGCINESCTVNDISKFTIFYKDLNTISSITLILNDYYIQINYDKNITVISILDTVILLDEIIIKRSFKVDLNDPMSLIDKVKLISLFS